MFSANELLDLARKIVSEHKPKKQEFVDPIRMRQVFYNVGHDLLEELSGYRNLRLKPEEIDELTMLKLEGGSTAPFVGQGVMHGDEHFVYLSLVSSSVSISSSGSLG